MKVKFARAEAEAVATELCAALNPVTERLIVAGSLRRRKAEVGDVEILFVPKFAEVKDGLFDTKRISLVDAVLDRLLAERLLARRVTKTGAEAWGEKNKLAVHVPSFIPVDFFAATAANWWNYLVCRTGPAATNIRIASAAQARGWKWNPYGEGFSRASGLGTEIHRVTSEREVFEFVGLEFQEPWERT